MTKKIIDSIYYHRERVSPAFLIRNFYLPRKVVGRGMGEHVNFPYYWWGARVARDQALIGLVRKAEPHVPLSVFADRKGGRRYRPPLVLLQHNRARKLKGSLLIRVPQFFAGTAR